MRKLPTTQILTLCAAHRGDLIRTPSGAYLTTGGKPATRPATALLGQGLIKHTGEQVNRSQDIEGEGVRPTEQGYALLAAYGIHPTNAAA
jgi:hypothetical protein